MNQHVWVQQCARYYEENGLTPGNLDDGDWEEAHYPAPKWAGGTETVRLLHGHHQVQGLLQSEEYGRCCFYNYDVRVFLKCGPFAPGWFELWDLYDKWKGDSGRKVGPKNGKNSIEALRSHPERREWDSKGGKKAGPANVESNFGPYRSENGKNFPLELRSKSGRENVVAMNGHQNTKKTRVENGRKLGAKNGKKNSKQVICLETELVYPSVRQASRQTGVCRSSIQSSCHSGCRAGGYHWQFVEQG
jgi:hypothetical protein